MFFLLSIPCFFLLLFLKMPSWPLSLLAIIFSSFIDILFHFCRYNTCEHCKLVFPSKSELIIHKEQQHPVEHFVCDICKETFLIKTQLRRHIKWHGKSKAMKKFRTCPLCPEIFPRYSGSKTLYHEHMRIVHNETISMSKRASAFKLCTCEVCGKLFKSKLKLKAHLLVHVEGKPFHCKETGCNAKFNQSKLLSILIHLSHCVT